MEEFDLSKLKAMVEGRPLPEPPSQEEAFELIDYTNPNFMSKPREEKPAENIQYSQPESE